MSDYIDRQAALDAIQAEREYMTRREEWLAEHILTHCGYRIIEDMPAADVEPVRHGRWEAFYAEELCGYRRAYYVCSNCFNSSDDEFDYCPNCGARMDGEADA